MVKTRVVLQEIGLVPIGTVLYQMPEPYWHKILCLKFIVEHILEGGYKVPTLSIKEQHMTEKYASTKTLSNPLMSVLGVFK